MDVKQGAVGRRHRRHSAEFKAKVVAECRHPGVSIASVALANGLNANLLRNWLIKRLSREVGLREVSLQECEVHFIRACVVSLWPARAERTHWQDRAAKGKARLRCFRPRR